MLIVFTWAVISDLAAMHVKVITGVDLQKKLVLIKPTKKDKNQNLKISFNPQNSFFVKPDCFNELIALHFFVNNYTAIISNLKTIQLSVPNNKAPPAL